MKRIHGRKRILMAQESTVEVGLVHVGRLRQSVLRSAFEGIIDLDCNCMKCVEIDYV